MQNNIFSRNLGFKAYELKDHLGNVRTTVSDVKIPNGTRGQAPFLADMITKNEYYLVTFVKFFAVFVFK